MVTISKGESLSYTLDLFALRSAAIILEEKQYSI